MNVSTRKLSLRTIYSCRGEEVGRDAWEPNSRQHLRGNEKYEMTENGSNKNLVDSDARVSDSTANTIQWSEVDMMLAHRLRRWPNIKATLNQCIVFAGSRLWGKVEQK